MPNALSRNAENTIENSYLQSNAAPVTYRLKVLSSPGKGGAQPTRTILFQRITGDESIEISVRTDASNLLTELPELLDAALAIRSALQPGERASEESERMRLLASERGMKRHRRARDKDGASRDLRLVGMTYRAPTLPATVAG